MGRIKKKARGKKMAAVKPLTPKDVLSLQIKASQKRCHAFEKAGMTGEYQNEIKTFFGLMQQFLKME
jgi:hypothetical protein